MERWSIPDEIREYLFPVPNAKCRLMMDGGFSAMAGGPMLYVWNRVPCVYPAEGNSLTVGATGEGKTRRFIVPLLISLFQAGESAVILDPKGELYRLTGSFAKKTHKVKKVNFKSLFDSMRWNGLDMIRSLFRSKLARDRALADMLLSDLADSLFPSSNQHDPFWVNSAKSLFIGLVYLMLEIYPDEDINILNVYHLLSWADETADGRNSYLKELVRWLEEKKTGSMAAILLRSYITTAEETRGGIRSVFLEGINIFARSVALQYFSSSSDLKVDELSGEEPTALYIIVPDENGVFDRLAGVMIGQIISHYIALADNVYKGPLPRRVNICLEELGNVATALPNLPHLTSAGRSRNLRIHMVLQSLSQLKTIYGQSKMDTILENVAVTVAFRNNNYDTLKELSLRCGEKYVSVNDHLEKAPLITPAQLGALTLGQALVMINGRIKYVTTFPDFTEIYDIGDPDVSDPEEAVEMEALEDVHVFDIKEYCAKNVLHGTVGRHRDVHSIFEI